jgi:hypothetical protein
MNKRWNGILVPMNAVIFKKTMTKSKRGGGGEFAVSLVMAAM